MFLWTVRLLNQILKVASKTYSSSETSTSLINFEKIGENIPAFFYVLLAIGWVDLMGRNIYSFNLLIQPLIDFFVNERTLGNYTFTIGNILIFFLVIGFSAIASKIVSFFASDKYNFQAAGNGKKINMGNWVLLIRITIISIGLFLAFAAAGIPLDKITIILGALGVGIGLGLQALVNNLVSGLIIAFEKPVNVGDIVDVSGISGKMKSIGFRSSIIATWDGADVIIPNGDILNAHLINWTLGSNNRRSTILVGVSYGTDLELAKKILGDILESDDHVLKNPAPVILFQDFGSSSIDIKINYWVGHYMDMSAGKSGLIVAIYKAFNENNIEIPYPQQDLHIKTIDGNNKKEI
jgi:small-conductance mechanosensitive channel